MLTFSLLDYSIYVRMSRRNHLLLEGKSDRRLFLELFESLVKSGRSRDGFATTDIETAEALLSSETPMGNREKVEQVSAAIGATDYAVRFAGFVDREFRGFELQDTILDTVGGHKVSGRLVWSRGHSVENYGFRYSLMREVFKIFTGSDQYGSALLLFESVFDSTLRSACAAAFAGLDLDKLHLVRHRRGR